MSEPYERVKEIRERHGGKEWWPTYREDPDWGPTPDGLTENDALDAVMEALNQEGVDAWSGDGTGIVAQMLHQQYSKRKALEARLSKMEELESERDMLRTVLDDTDKAELLEGLEQSTKEALTLRERVEGLEKIIADERACEECWEGKACGSDCHMLDVVALAEDDLDKLTTQQKPTEEAMEEA